VHSLLVGIVEVEHVRAHAIQQRRARDVQPLFTAEKGCLRRPRERSDSGERPVDRFVPSGADRAAEPVEQRTLRFVAHGSGNARVFRLDDIAGEDAGCFDFLVHRVAFDLGVGDGGTGRSRAEVIFALWATAVTPACWGAHFALAAIAAA
jgi:hypothetical protein